MGAIPGFKPIPGFKSKMNVGQSMWSLLMGFALCLWAYRTEAINIRVGMFQNLLGTFASFERSYLDTFPCTWIPFCRNPKLSNALLPSLPLAGLYCAKLCLTRGTKKAYQCLCLVQKVHIVRSFLLWVLVKGGARQCLKLHQGNTHFYEQTNPTIHPPGFIMEQHNQIHTLV